MASSEVFLKQIEGALINVYNLSHPPSWKYQVEELVGEYGTHFTQSREFSHQYMFESVNHSLITFSITSPPRAR